MSGHAWFPPRLCSRLVDLCPQTGVNNPKSLSVHLRSQMAETEIIILQMTENYYTICATPKSERCLICEFKLLVASLPQCNQLHYTFLLFSVLR